MRQWGALLLDVDGTLTDRSSGAYLAEHLGHSASVARAEAAYARGECSNDDVCRVDAAGWVGHTVSEVSGWLAAMPVRAGVELIADWAASRGLLVFLASVAWRPVSDSLEQRYGFIATGGPELEVAGGVYTGRVARLFNEYDKRDAALASAARHGVSRQRCIAVGDSRSDIPLFAAAGHSIAFSADPAAQAAAAIVVSGETFDDVLASLDTVNR